MAQNGAASVALGGRQRVAKRILAYLQDNEGGKVIEYKSCWGEPMLPGVLRCTAERAKGVNWHDMQATIGDQFHYSLTGKNADKIELTPPGSVSKLCGTVANHANLAEISWAYCNSNDKASVTFYKTPSVEIDDSCVPYPANPAEKDWCSRRLYVLTK